MMKLEVAFTDSSRLATAYLLLKDGNASHLSLEGTMSNTRLPKGTPPVGEEHVTELSFLLPRWQVAALAETAQQQGLTVGQFLRGLVNHALDVSTVVSRRSDLGIALDRR